MNKPSLIKLFSLLVIVSTLVGCTSAKTTEPSKPAETTAPQPTQPPVEKVPVTLSLVRPGMGDDAIKEDEALMKRFNEKYPYIKVEFLIIAPGEVSQKLQTAIAGGTPPDIAMMGSEALTFIENDLLLDLTSYAAKDGFDWKGYYHQQAIDAFNPQGKIYCIPETYGSTAFAYNKDMFDAAGVSYPNENWTWDDMVAAAQKLTLDTNSDGTIDQWGLVTIPYDYQPWIWAAGSSLYNEDFSKIQDDSVVVDTFQWLADLRFKYKVSPTDDILSAFPDPGFMFQQNQAAMYTARWIPDTVFFFAGIEFKWDVTLMPKNPKTGIRPSGFGSGCNGVFKATKHPEEAYLVWKWLNSDEGGYARSVENSGTPIIPGGPADKWPKLTAAFTQVKSPANAKAFIDMLSFTKLTNLPLGNADEITSAIDPILDELWLGDKSAAEVVPLIKSAVDPLLKK